MAPGSSVAGGLTCSVPGPGRRGEGGGVGADFHMKRAEMLVANFELNPSRRPIFLTPKKLYPKSRSLSPRSLPLPCWPCDTAYLHFGLFLGYVIQNSLPHALEIQPDPTNQIFVYFSLDVARSL